MASSPASYSAWATAQGYGWGACGENAGRLPKSWKHIDERPTGYWATTGDWVSTTPTEHPRSATPQRRSAVQPTPAVPTVNPTGWDPALTARMWAMVREIDQQHADIRMALAHR